MPRNSGSLGSAGKRMPGNSDWHRAAGCLGSAGLASGTIIGLSAAAGYKKTALALLVVGQLPAAVTYFGKLEDSIEGCEWLYRISGVKTLVLLMQKYQLSTLLLTLGGVLAMYNKERLVGKVVRLAEKLRPFAPPGIALKGLMFLALLFLLFKTAERKGFFKYTAAQPDREN